MIQVAKLTRTRLRLCPAGPDTEAENFIMMIYCVTVTVGHGHRHGDKPEPEESPASSFGENVTNRDLKRFVIVSFWFSGSTVFTQPLRG